MTRAANAIADRKTFGHLSYRVATRLQSLSLPNMISMRLRRLYLRLSYLTVFLHCFRPGMQARIPLSCNASLNQSASYPRSPSNQSTFGRLPTRARAGSHEQEQRTALTVTDSVQLGVHAALGATDQAATSPLFTARLDAVR